MSRVGDRVVDFARQHNSAQTSTKTNLHADTVYWDVVLRMVPRLSLNVIYKDVVIQKVPRLVT